MQPFTIIIFGAPGSGKGTQAKLFEQFFARHDSARRQVSFSTGERFRAIARGKSYSSALIREILDRGGLQPEFLAIWLWAGIFIEELKGDEHIIADGYPRMPIEGEALDTAFSFYKREALYALNLTLTKEQAIQRLGLRQAKEGRSDDQMGALDRRFKLYEEKTVPTINIFRNNPRYRFYDIDGSQTIEAVYRDILKVLNLSSYQ